VPALKQKASARYGSLAAALRMLRQGYGQKKKVNVHINCDLLIPDLETEILRHVTVLCIQF
jgi:hypothetical protein